MKKYLYGCPRGHLIKNIIKLEVVITESVNYILRDYSVFTIDMLMLEIFKKSGKAIVIPSIQKI